LFWAGSHGVPRKTFGASQELRTPEQVFGMGLMGLGGAIAILGGIAFILNMLPALIRPADGIALKAGLENLAGEDTR
ncbi:MAG TPA: hypothetical protein VN944_08740, partial [Nitrospiria bacterium]|nr:hypothetical protein [Nitrospiria bacterium]